MEMTGELSNTSNNPAPKVLLGLLLLGFIFAVGLNLSHAVNVNHSDPKNSTDARNCFRKYGSQLVLFEGGKAIRYCYDPENKNVAVRVLKIIGNKAEEITAYMKTEGVNGIYKTYTLIQFWKFVSSKVNNGTVTAISPEGLKFLANHPDLSNDYLRIMQRFGGY